MNDKVKHPDNQNDKCNKKNCCNEDKKNKHQTENTPAQTEDENQIELLKAEITKLKDSYLRAYAETENTKKRCQQEIEKNTKFAISSFAKELLSVADDLQRAITSVPEENKAQCAALLQGVKMTQNELSHVFEKFGIKKIESIGKIFDPNLERVVQEVEDNDKPSGTIIAELQSAYTINDRILREAMVIVTKSTK